MQPLSHVKRAASPGSSAQGAAEEQIRVSTWTVAIKNFLVQGLVTAGIRGSKQVARYLGKRFSSDGPVERSSIFHKKVKTLPVSTAVGVNGKEKSPPGISDKARKQLEYFLRMHNNTARVEAKFQLNHLNDATTILDHIPRDLLNEVLTVAFVKEHGLSISDIPKESLTRNLMLECFKEKLPGWITRIEKKFEDGDRNDLLIALPASIQGLRTSYNTRSKMRPVSSHTRSNKLVRKPWASIKTEYYCRKHLEEFPSEIQCCPEQLLREHPEWVDRALKHKNNLIGKLPVDMLTPDLVRKSLSRYIKQKDGFDNFTKIPESIWRKHPDIRLLAARCGGLTFIPTKFLTVGICRIGIEAVPSCFKYVPEWIRPHLPDDLLLAVAPEYLDPVIRQQMLANGDTTLPVNTQYRSKPSMDRDVLLTPMRPMSCAHPFHAGSFLNKVVMADCSNFKMRNDNLGQVLKNEIEGHHWKSRMAYNKTLRSYEEAQKDDDTIPFYNGEITSEWARYGGRALMKDNGGRYSRLKFLRAGEDFKDFVREEAVQRFAINNHKELGLKSEIPEPVGLRFVPVGKVEQEIIKDLRSKPEIVKVNGQDCYLVYEFTTCDHTYSTLAHQKDAQGGCVAAEQGLLKACHDLGVWSSLGALHTSTIRAYHNFAQERREIFLLPVLNNGDLAYGAFPGTLRDWAGRALVESDWGYTGLRDLGDLEFYPDLKEIFQNNDIPPEVKKNRDLPHLQRAAFLNTLCENMVAPILHYAKLHRDDQDYSYREESEGMKKLALFIEKSLNTYLSGMMGKETTAQAFFESPEIYQEWLLKMAQETAMWTARQNMESDCYARSLEKKGCYPETVYPDDRVLKHQYPEDCTTDGQDNLGQNNSQFGLTLFIRGVYQILAGLAVELSG